jgi:hypothetical protein
MKGLKFILSCMMALSLLVACDASSGGQSSKTAVSLLALSKMPAEDQGAKLSAALINDVFSGDTLNANVFSNDLLKGVISGSTFNATTLPADLLIKGRILLHWEPGLKIYISVNTVSPYGVKFEFIFDNYWAHDVLAPLETCSGTLVTTAGTSGSNFVLTLNGTLTFKNTTISIDPVTVSFQNVRLGFDVLDAVITQSSVFIMDGNIEVDGRGITLDAVRQAIAALKAAAGQ